MVALAPIGLTHLFMACSPASTSADGDVADAYAVVIEWFADRSSDDPDPLLVFVEARGEGFEIELPAQASVVEASASFADVQFIDDRSEAIGDDGVRDDGILLALGPAVMDGDGAIVECDEIVTSETMTSWRFELRYVRNEWLLVHEPTELEP